MEKSSWSGSCGHEGGNHIDLCQVVTEKLQKLRVEIVCLVLGLARDVFPRGEDDGLVGQRLSGDGAERDEAVVVSAYGAVGAAAAVPAAAAVAVVATNFAAGLAVSAQSRPMICDT